MKQVSANVISNEWILPPFEHPRGNILGSQIIWLDCPEIAIEAKPGQFVMVRCGEECVLPRPFSVHRVNGNRIAIFYAVWEDGKGTNWLSQRTVGARVELFGPLGNGFPIYSTSQKLLLVAGGHGVAPLIFLAQQALGQKCSVKLLMGVKTAGQLYPEQLLPVTTEAIIATEDGNTGYKGLVTELLPDFVDWADQIFACGPLAMYKDMATKYPQLRNKPVQISLEVRMGCGRGVCYGCTIKTKNGLKRVCQDGPVFDLDDILWDELGL